MKTKRTNIFQIHLQETNYEIRVEEVNGITFWVVPVVMMVEGVHSGSRGAMLYSEEELAASVSEWNGMPVTIGHPQNEEGVFISASTPSALSDIVGRIYNPKMKGTKLTAEAWIDVNALTSRSQDALEYIKEKKSLDVSVGVFSEEVRVKGTFNGEAYKAEAVNLIPDHLALLPGEVGACAWDDGCGIRINSKNKMKTKNGKKKEDTISKADWLAALLEQGSAMQLTTNEASFHMILSAIQDQLNAMDNPIFVFYLEEVYDTYFVYCALNRETRSRSLYKRNYVLAVDGKATLQGEPVQVRKEVSFVTVNTGKHIRTNFKQKTKGEMKTNAKPCTVDALIKNEANSFTEEDREWLSAMSQEQLEKLTPKAAAKKEETTTNKKDEAASKEEAGESLVKKGADGVISINGKTIDSYIRESLAKETDPVKFIDNFMPDELKGQLKSGLSMYRGRRNKLVKDIAANSKFKEEQLKTWSDADLEALHGTVVSEDEEEGNFAPLGAGGNESAEGDEKEVASEISAMMSFSEEKPKKEKEALKK